MILFEFLHHILFIFLYLLHYKILMKVKRLQDMNSLQATHLMVLENNKYILKHKSNLDVDKYMHDLCLIHDRSEIQNHHVSHLKR